MVTTRLRTGAGRRVNYRALAGLRPLRPRRVALTRPVGRRAGMVRRGLTRVVRSIVNRTQETKYVTCPVEINVAHNSAMGQSDQFRVMPAVGPGTGDFQRVGDTIRPTGLWLRGVIAMNTSTIKPLAVRILCLQFKGNKTWTAAQNAWSTNSDYKNLLKYNTETGSADNLEFTGNQQDLFMPVNREMFDVLGDRTLKLTGHLNNTATESAPHGTLSRSFAMKIRTPPVIRYSNSTTTEPQNFAPFFTVGYSYLDGTAPDTVTTAVIANVYAQLYYKDS